MRTRTTTSRSRRRADPWRAPLTFDSRASDAISAHGAGRADVPRRLAGLRISSEGPPTRSPPCPSLRRSHRCRIGRVGSMIQFRFKRQAALSAARCRAIRPRAIQGRAASHGMASGGLGSQDGRRDRRPDDDDAYWNDASTSPSRAGSSAAKEERAQLFDPSHPAYPILARTLTARRDNLRAHHRRAGKATCQSSCALLSLGSSLVRVPAAGYGVARI